MFGWLVVNHFLNANKFSELNTWLLEAGKRNGLPLVLKTNAELTSGDLETLVEKESPSFVLFWDKDIRLASYLEQLGLPVFNSSHAIEVCDDKSLTYLVLKKHGIRMPKTLLGPKTFEGVGYTDLSFLEQVEETLGYPLVLKECYGSFGQQVYLVHNQEELYEKVRQTAPKPIIFQEFIQSSFAKDIRVQIVGNEVVASMYRYSDTGDFRANITNGGKMMTYKPTLEQEQVALQAAKAIGLEFAGVDLLFGEEGEPIVCEVNSNAHFKNIFDCSGVNVADCMIQHVKKCLVESF